MRPRSPAGFVRRVFSVLFLSLILCACAASPEPATGAGVRHVDRGLESYDDVNTGKAVIVAYPDFQKATELSVRYSDGTEMTLRCYAYHARKDPRFCSIRLALNERTYGIVPLDGHPWMDSELWEVVTFDARETDRYQACLDGKVYSASELTDLMDGLEKLRDAHGDNEKSAAKEELQSMAVGDANALKIPVCNWRHRVGLDAVLPASKNVSRISFVPSSSDDSMHVEISDPGARVKVYPKATPGLDPYQARDLDLDQVVLISNDGHAMTLKPITNSAQCTSFKQCDHFEIDVDGRQMEIQTLDEKQLSESHLMQFADTATHQVSYGGCEGSRLVLDKDRGSVEQELKVVQNSATMPTSDHPPVAHSETADHGTLPIPAEFCEWSRKTSLTDAMKAEAQ